MSLGALGLGLDYPSFYFKIGNTTPIWVYLEEDVAVGCYNIHLQKLAREKEWCLYCAQTEKKTAKFFRVYKPVLAERSKHTPVDR